MEMQAYFLKGGLCNESTVFEKTGPGFEENSFMFFCRFLLFY
jgi:hypothetical protein